MAVSDAPGCGARISRNSRSPNINVAKMSGRKKSSTRNVNNVASKSSRLILRQADQDRGFDHAEAARCMADRAEQSGEDEDDDDRGEADGWGYSAAA